MKVCCLHVYYMQNPILTHPNPKIDKRPVMNSHLISKHYAFEAPAEPEPKRVFTWTRQVEDKDGNQRAAAPAQKTKIRTPSKALHKAKLMENISKKQADMAKTKLKSMAVKLTDSKQALDALQKSKPNAEAKAEAMGDIATLFGEFRAVKGQVASTQAQYEANREKRETMEVEEEAKWAAELVEDEKRRLEEEKSRLEKVGLEEEGGGVVEEGEVVVQEKEGRVQEEEGVQEEEEVQEEGVQEEEVQQEDIP